MNTLISDYGITTVISREVPGIVRNYKQYSEQFNFANSLSDIDKDIDLVLVDIYGTIWDGTRFYPGALDTLEHMRNNGKVIIIVSNTTGLSKDETKKYNDRGLIQGRHYDAFVTSGDIFREAMIKNEISMMIGIQNGHDLNYYIYGTLNGHLFEGLENYKKVEDAKKADFVYIAIPQLTLTQYESYPSSDKTIFKKSKSFKDEFGNSKFDSIVIEPFIGELKEFKELNLPIVIANNDLVAPEIDDEGQKVHVVRQGALAELYKNMGGKVISFGKPNDFIFKKVLDIAKNELDMKELEYSRVLMVGDTLETDVLGGNNFHIKTALVATGNMNYELLQYSSRDYSDEEESLLTRCKLVIEQKKYGLLI